MRNVKNKPTSSDDNTAGLTRKELKRQISMKKQREELEKDTSPVKTIKIEKSPSNNTK